jgi:hypothetical protein
MIEIIAHRGLWNKNFQPNSKEAIKHALRQGFSIETDIRDFNGTKIAISHDPINFRPGEEFMFEEYLDLVDLYLNKNSKSFLNIKADGLELILQNFETLKNNSNFFFFDGSFPTMKKLKENNFFCLDRISEFEHKSDFKFDGYWIDSFNGDWMIDENLIKFDSNSFIVFVSPELHNRSHEKLWRWIKNNLHFWSNEIGLCTDFPEKARNFFND